MTVIKKSDNTRAVKQALNEGIAQALEACGLYAETQAKKRCPIDTGRLRNSITHKVSTDDKTVIIGTNVEYAPYVELDETKAHKGSTSAHFLRNSVQGKEAVYRKIIKQYLK